MKARLFSFNITMAILTILSLTWSGLNTVQAKAPGRIVGASLVSIDPESFDNGVNMPVTISGSDLSGVTSAWLGDVALRNLMVISSSEVKALVPWSIAPGPYDLTVKSASAPDAVLPGAVTISQGSSDWTSNGPYGGDLYEVVVDQKDPTRLYVAASRSGLWRSQNSGANWDYSQVSPYPHRVQIAYPTPGQPPVLYITGGLNMPVLRSLDYGQTWVDKTPNDLPGNVRRTTDAFVRPGQLNSVYLAVHEDIGRLYQSDNQGDDWTVVNGTDGWQVSSIAFDPDHPDTNVVLATTDGKIYTTANNFVTWSDPVTLTNKVGQLVFAPTLYNGKRSLFAIPCDYEGMNYGSGCSNGDAVFVSGDGGQNWDTLATPPDLLVNDLAFSDAISGTMWAAMGDGYYSEDEGATWQPLASGLANVRGFAVVPGANSRQTTTLFAATNTGLYKSSDGGDSWVEFDNGIGANLARTIAISPFNADEAYAATQAKGLLHTYNGGRNWQSLAISISGYDAAIATDPFSDGVVYFGNTMNTGLQPSVRVSGDHGNTFNEYALTLPAPYIGHHADVTAIAPDPQIENRLLAGVCMGSSGSDQSFEPGFIYASTDGGAAWEQQATPEGITCISSALVFDPNNPDIVYAGSLNMGLLRSTDSGATWTQANTSGFGIAARTNSTGMTTFGNSLYVGTANTTSGGEIWRYDGAAWTQVVSGGFGDANNTVINALYWVKIQLFAVTKNQVSGTQVWTTIDGTNWTPLNQNGFGNKNNNDLLWSNSSAAFANSYFVGTWYGDIWQYAVKTFSIYLPAIQR